MAILGLGSDDSKAKKSDDKKKGNKDKKSNEDEAAEILAKMEAKKDAGDCPFC